MTTAYQHRPLSKILAPTADPDAEGLKEEDQPRNEDGTFASPAAQSQENELPEKYRGKTAAEIAQMHMNAEQELGRVRNEVGTYRGLVSDLTSLQHKPQESKPVEQAKVDVSGDELLGDPSGAIDKVVTHRLSERDAREAEIRQSEAATVETNALLAAYPNLDKIVASPEFQQFAARTPSRQQDFYTAANAEGLEQVRAARRLMEDFEDFNSQSTAPREPEAAAAGTPVQAQTPVQQAANVSTEGAGSTGAVSTAPLIYETDVIKLINSDPNKYRSPSFQKELTTAMREGRYVKQG